MKIKLTFNDGCTPMEEFQCITCGELLTDEGDFLLHPETVDDGVFTEKLRKIDCPFVGVQAENPLVFEAKLVKAVPK